MKRSIVIILPLFLISSCASNDVVKIEQSTNDTNIKEISIDVCDLSGKRQANVKVNIGYNDGKIKRNYYAYTNEYGQVVKVDADKLILQTKDEEIKSIDIVKMKQRLKVLKVKIMMKGILLRII